MKITLFKKQNNFKKKDFIFHQNFYWIIILLGTIIIIFLSFLFGYRLFIKISQKPILQFTNKDGAVDTINQDHILKALNYFSEREKKSNKILSSPSPVVDPSL